MSNRRRSPDTDEARARAGSATPKLNIPRTVEPRIRPKTGPGGRDEVNRAAPAQVWWAQNHWTNFDETDRWIATDPEHGLEYQNLLYQASVNGWDEERLYTEAEKRGMFEWMANRMAGAPGFLGDDGSGPGGGGGGGGGGGAPTADQIATAAATIRNIAGQLGVPMADEQINELATKVIEQGWSQDQVYDQLTAAVDWATTQPGTLQAGVDQIRQLAAQYLMPISEDTAREYSVRLSSEEMGEEALRTLFSTQAAQQYGWMGEAIAAGMTPREFLLPARDKIASVLELNPGDVDLMDEGVLKMVSVADPETRATRAATLTEIEYAARRDPRWRNTKNASDLLASATVAISDAFGGRG